MRKSPPTPDKANPIILRAVLGTLPLLGLSLEGKAGVFYGTAGAGTLLVTTLIFLGPRLGFPEKVYRIALFLIFLTLAILGKEIFSVSLLLLVSLCLLVPPELFRKSKKGKWILRRALLTSGIFWLLLVGHGLISGWLGRHWGIWFFQQPAGSYFLLGLFWALFVKKRTP